MNQPDIPKAYDAAAVEKNLYERWEKSGFFNPDNLPGRRGKAFTISMPPPNATGILHVGHAMFLTIQDVVSRFQRMLGRKVLWLPGTDHAAIATQTKVEKIIQQEGQDKYDLGREKFLQRVEAFVADSQTTIRSQIRTMGSSCDWSRERYTLDDGLSRAVREAFVRMYHDGLIYRGERIVNWCPRCESTLADDEVEYKEEKTKFYYFKYGPVIIGTARPETKFLDKTIVVHPDDHRYQKWIGQSFDVEWIDGSVKANVISDPLVDQDFGTGAMTITPAHSFEDFDLAKKHKLPIVKIIDEQGNFTDAAGALSGHNARESRALIVERLKARGLLDHIDDHYVHNLSVCYRCGTPVEPLPKDQWWLDVNKKLKKLGNKSLKQKALEVVKKKQIEIIPERFNKTYYHWMENLRDWCVSRQIWFGHRVPAWFKKDSRFKIQDSKVWDLKIYGKETFEAIRSDKKTIETRAGREREEGEKDWSKFRPGDSIRFTLVDPETEAPVKDERVEKKIISVDRFDSIDSMLEKFSIKNISTSGSVKKYKDWWKKFPEQCERIEKFGIWAFGLGPIEKNDTPEVHVGVDAPVGDGWEQDSDTLDTWFSSGLWTFSTLGWPDKTKDLKTFHPTSLMETGYDILFFWVARMIIMSVYHMGEVPFQQVYLHGLVRDEQGRKMSKSLGNIIDPVDMTKKYGTDAVRLSLIIGNTPGNDVNVGESKIAGFRNFTNKLWNISRFVFMTVREVKPIHKMPKPKTSWDTWILSRLQQVIHEVTQSLQAYEFSHAGEILREFTWNDFADWYLEVAKIEKDKDPILLCVLQELLKMWHPFMPFVTEEIWKNFHTGGLIMVESWPAALKKSSVPSAGVADTQSVVTAIRNIKAENKMTTDKDIRVMVIGKPGSLTLKNIMDDQAIIKSLARIQSLDFVAAKDKPKSAPFKPVNDVEVYVVSAAPLDTGKLKKEIGAKEAYIESLKKKLGNREFVSKAPGHIIDAERKKLQLHQEQLDKLKSHIDNHTP